MRFMVFWRSSVLQQWFCALREWSEAFGAVFMQNKQLYSQNAPFLVIL